MLTRLPGPYKIFDDLRNWAVNKPWSPLYCFFCTSVWVSFITAFWYTTDPGHLLMYMFGCAGAAVIIERLFDYFEIVTVMQEAPKIEPKVYSEEK